MVVPGAFSLICSAAYQRGVRPFMAHAECGRTQRYVPTNVRGVSAVDGPIRRTGVGEVPDRSS